VVKEGVGVPVEAVREEVMGEVQGVMVVGLVVN
jgi:hypothetical protein